MNKITPESEPTAAFYEVEVDYHFTTKMVVEATSEVAAVDAYGKRIDDALLRSERALTEACGNHVEVESCDLQTDIVSAVRELDACRHCNGSGMDREFERNPCLPCDGEGWEAK